MTASLFQPPPQTLLQHQATSAVFADRVASDPAAPFPGRWRKVVSFFVAGCPRPGGSKKASFIPKRGGGFVTRPDGRPIIAVRDMGGEKTENWRSCVAHECRKARQGDLIDGVIGLKVEYRMPRPKGHYGKGRNASVLKASSPSYHTSAPDTTKLTRSLEDALTNVLWRDDAAVTEQRLRKIYAASPGAQITVWILEEGGGSC